MNAIRKCGEQIFYRVDSNQDLKWVWWLKRAVDQHRAVNDWGLGNLSDKGADADDKEVWEAEPEEESGLDSWMRERGRWRTRSLWTQAQEFTFDLRMTIGMNRLTQ
jgi:hypothetical protein